MAVPRIIENVRATIGILSWALLYTLISGPFIYLLGKLGFLNWAGLFLIQCNTKKKKIGSVYLLKLNSIFNIFSI